MKTNHVLGALGLNLPLAISVICVCTSLVVLLCADSSMAMTDNLLENGGAESGNSDWQAWGYFKSVSTLGSKGPHGGGKFFYAGDDNEQSELYQDIDVSGYAGKIDHPPSAYNYVKATLSGTLNSYAGHEWPVLRIEFLNSSGGIIGEREIQKGTTYSTWSKVERASIEVPSGTRTVRVKMRSYRRSGSDNDGFFDDDLAVSVLGGNDVTVFFFA